MDREGAVLEVTLYSSGKVDLLVKVLKNSSKGKGEMRSHEGKFLILNISPL